MVKAAKQAILRIAFLKGMGEKEFFVPSCGQGFYGLNAGIVKGQGTQAKHIKRERESVCISYSPTFVYKARMFLLVLCKTVLCATFL